jgi:competence protein ComGC
VSSEVEAAKKVVLRGRREDTFVGRRRALVVISLLIICISVLYLIYLPQITEIIEKLTN